MKKNQKDFLTNETLDKKLLEAVDAILSGIEHMGFAKKEDVEKVEKRVENLENKVEIIDHKLDNLAANTPTTQRVEKLEKKLNIN